MDDDQYRTYYYSSYTSAATPTHATPCAACKILRRRCAADKCVLAPYFPPAEPLRFATAHRVFGAGNITKLLQELPESQRADAVSSIVYEAAARIRDPVYGCAGAVCQLQKQVDELSKQLARARAELLSTQLARAELLSAQAHQKSLARELICAQQDHGSTSTAQDGGSAAAGIFQNINDANISLDEFRQLGSDWNEHELLLCATNSSVNS